MENNGTIKLDKTIGFWTGAAVMILAAAALIDRYLGTLFLTTWHNNILVYIRLNAAFGHLLTGLFLVLYSIRPRGGITRTILWILALTVFLIGFLTFVEFIFGIDLNIDQLLGNEELGGVWSLFTTRMAFAATVAFMLIGGAFILLLSSPFLGVFVAEIFGMLTSVIGLTALFSIGLSHLPFLESFGFGVSFPYMAVILAVLFILSGIGVWFNDRPAKRTFFGIAAKFSLLQSLIFLITFSFIAYVDGQQIIGETTVEPGSFLVITNFLVILDQFQRIGFLFFFVILASLINLWVIRKSIIEPIEQLAAVAKEIAEKKYRKVLPISRYNAEIGDLYRAVQAMADSLFKELQELEYVNWIKAGFISAVSSQLLVPLKTIKQNIGALLENPEGLSEVHKKNIRAIGEISGKISNLIQDIANISAMEEGRVAIHPQPVNVNDVLSEHIASLIVALSLEERELIVYDFKPSVKITSIDKRFLEQAFYNILDNAIKYGVKDANVRVTVEMTGDQKEFLISVFNQGPKIPEAEQFKIFTKFFRGETARKLYPVGTGLGLIIAKTAVEANGGKIWFESGDAGTTFYFTVPVREPERK
ncbi:MAG: HAMP domain-containing sensor histidine kinase [Patescibacteria group bacterium]